MGKDLKFLPPLERVFLFQDAKRAGGLRLESVLLAHQRRERRGVSTGNAEQSSLRNFRRYSGEVVGRRLHIESLSWIAQPHVTANQTRLPIDFAFDQPCDVFVSRFAKYPLAPLEV